MEREQLLEELHRLRVQLKGLQNDYQALEKRHQELEDIIGDLRPGQDLIEAVMADLEAEGVIQ